MRANDVCARCGHLRRAHAESRACEHLSGCSCEAFVFGAAADPNGFKSYAETYPVSGLRVGEVAEQTPLVIGDLALASATEFAALKAENARLLAHLAALPACFAPAPPGDRRPGVVGGECFPCLAKPGYHEADCPKRTAGDGERVTDAELAEVLRDEAARAQTAQYPLTSQFHRIQGDHADGVLRAVFINSEDEPVGLPCHEDEARAIAAGARALLLAPRMAAELLALRARLRVCETVEVHAIEAPPGVAVAPMPGPAGCDGGRPGCSVCDALDATEEQAADAVKASDR